MDDKMKILQMVENKEITVEEGIKLLEALDDDVISIPEEEINYIDLDVSKDIMDIDISTIASDILIKKDTIELMEVEFFDKQGDMIDLPE